MNTVDALYRLAHDYPGGLEALALRADMKTGVLRNKVNTNSTNNVISIQEFILLCSLTGDFRPLIALCAELSHTCTKVDEQPGGDIAVLEVATDIWAKLGDLGAEVHKAMADGRIEPHEVKAIEAATFAAFRPMMQLLARVNGMCERGGA